MKKLIAPLVAVACPLLVMLLMGAAGPPKTPVYSNPDGTLAAPTQFFNVSILPGANVSILYRLSNMVISASGSNGTVNLSNLIASNITIIQSIIFSNAATNRPLILDGNNAVVDRPWPVTNTVAPGLNIVVTTNNLGAYTVFVVATDTNVAFDTVIATNLILSGITTNQPLIVDGNSNLTSVPWPPTNTFTPSVNNSPLTNDGNFVFFSDRTPSNNAPILMRRNDGSLFIGSNSWADGTGPWTDPFAVYAPWTMLITASNNPQSAYGHWEVRDTVAANTVGNIHLATFAGLYGLGYGQWYASQGGNFDRWEISARTDGSRFVFEQNGGITFMVTNGQPAKIRGVTYDWPNANAAGVLQDDGAGNLSWTPVGSLGAVTNLGGGTNISIRVAGGTNFVDTTGELNNWAQIGTNAITLKLDSNTFWGNLLSIPYTDYTNRLYIIGGNASLTTNADGTVGLTITATNVDNFLVTNILVVSNVTVKGNVYISQTNFVNYLVVSQALVAGDLFVNSVTSTNGTTNYGPAISYSPSASNAPAANEFPTAHWVRSLFNNGLTLYNSTNECVATNTDEPHIVHLLTNTIPPTDRRHYPAVNVNDYVGSVTATNRFLTLQGPIYVHAWLERTNGTGSVSLSVHPELYYSYDTPFGTNWYGDFAANDQVITTGTNLYEWVISFPTITSTNATGFAIERRFKVGAVSGATHPGLVVHIGTNIWSGISDASHISIPGTGGTGGSGTTTVVVTNVGVLTTNIAYATNQQFDFSFMYNDYWMTNTCANHINLCPTNLTGGGSLSLSIVGTNAYTNWNVYFTWPGGATVTWLSITNGTPTTTLTSNKTQFYTFLVRTNPVSTNVIAAFKEQP